MKPAAAAAAWAARGRGRLWWSQGGLYRSRWAGWQGGPRRWPWRFLRIMSSLQEHTFNKGTSAPGWAGLQGGEVEQDGGVERQTRNGRKSEQWPAAAHEWWLSVWRTRLGWLAERAKREEEFRLDLNGV
jgi:hypothetical protein